MNSKTCTFLSLLLSLALQALSEKCPDPDRLPTTCQCDEYLEDDGFDVSLVCGSATLQELEDALSLVDKDTRLDLMLDDMNLGYLPPRIFDGLNVVRLDISHCKLEGLAPQGQLALVGLEDKLHSLAITSSFTEENQHTKIDLGHLRRLSELDLSFNAITEVDDDWFARVPASLTSLVLSNNGIERIGERAFANLVNLDRLWLDGNRFGPLKRSMLPRPAYRLENLELDNNEFNSIPDDLFTDMPELRELSIRTNRVTHLTERAFKPIWSQLTVFDARGNPLECDSTMEWLFDERTEAKVLGTCEGPQGREGLDLKKFIQNRGE